MRRLLLPLAVLACCPAGVLAGDPPPEPPPAAPADGTLERMFDPDFREGKPDDPLTKDGSPLLRGHVDALIDLFEAAHDVALTVADEQALRDAVEGAWAGWDAGAKDALRRRLVERDAVADALRRGDPESARRHLDAFAADLDARIAAAPKAPHHALLERVKQRKREIFSAGAPAVTSVAQDAFEETVLFLLRVARNEDAPVTDGQRQALREETRKIVDRTGDAVRRHYARMPRLWRLVKARWEQADDAGKLRMRWAARLLCP